MKRVKAVLTAVNAAVKAQSPRKSLQSIQDCDIETKVTSKEMALSREKNLSATVKKPKTVEQLIASEKENVPRLRRSKRKTTVTESVVYTESPEQSTLTKSSKSKAKKLAPKTKKSRSTAKKGSTADSTQTKLSFAPLLDIPEEKEVSDIKESKTIETEKITLGVSFSSGATEDSGYAPSAEASHECTSHSMAIFNSPGVRSYPGTPVISETNMLTDKSASLSYWMDLAEQRRISLEKALQENDQLHDQLAVLEGENSLMKNLLEEAEKMAQILKDMIN